MNKNFISLLLAASLVISAGCGKCGKNNNSASDDSGTSDSSQEPIVRVEDNREISAFEYTVSSVSSTDKVGRTVRTGDGEQKDKYVGLFYFIWHGNDDTTRYGKVYDITKLLETSPDELWYGNDPEISPFDKFHYWGEPLYGYYCSYDPYIIRKHCELLTMAGVDYIIYDATNANPYTNSVSEIFKIYQEYYDMGWDVPKIAFYCNTYTDTTVRTIYNTWYKNGLYKDLWFSLDGKKPLIIGALNEVTNPAEYAQYVDFFDFRIAQWPYGMDVDEERGFPWMSWEYPQLNYNGTMSVSLAQHPGAKMSDGKKNNNGRGFDYGKWRNNSANTELGTNFEGQWQTVFENNADPANKQINNVFITGFNEWKAVKMADRDGKAFFVDTFSEEYSRDIEMMKGGYDDNYYLQMADILRKFKYTPAKHYKYSLRTIDIEDASLASWAGVREYLDFTGDKALRNFSDAFGYSEYIDNSGRNDIAKVFIAHDKDNLYVRADAVEDITAYNGTDENWMTLFIKTDEDIENSFAGYKFAVNRKPQQDGKTSLEKSTGGYNWQSAGGAEYRVYGNSIVYKVPLAALGLSAEDCFVQIKVSDNVTHPGDIMDYYVSGDSAPIGRLSYTYGY